MIGNLLKGILIGIGGIIPGLSGAVIAMIFGLYDKMVYCIANFFYDFKKNFVFMFPILTGIGIGFIAFSNVQKILLEKYPFYTMLVIIGLIVGTVPALFKGARIKKFNIVNISVVAFTLIIGLVMSYMSDTNLDIQNKVLELNFTNILNLMLIGFIMAGSHIIPGISGTVLLMILGSYGIMLNAIANLKNLFIVEMYINHMDLIIYNIFLIIPMAIGLIVGAIIFSKLMDYLLKHFHTLTYCAIIGFVIGSIPSIVPPMDYSTKTIIGMLLFVISTYISYKVSLFE